MSADLYTLSMDTKLSGHVAHFRDYYNPSSVLWAMNLSWWKDVTPMLNRQKYLPVENAKKLLGIIKRSEIDLINNYSESMKKHAQNYESFNQEYMETRKIELINFLERSIEMNLMIYCDL